MSIGESLPELPADASQELHEMKMQLENAMAEVEARLALIEEAMSGGSDVPSSYIWTVEEGTGDLHPADASDAGIGTLNNPSSHLALGSQTPLGVEGVLAPRADANGGGLAAVGCRNEDPGIDPTPNAPCELAGTAVMVSVGQLWLEVPAPTDQTEDRYLVASPSLIDSRGRHYTPVALGPKVIYSQEDRQEDSRDIALIATTTTVVTLTLANAYNAGDYVFRYGVQLSELGDRTADFTIEIHLNGGLMVTVPMSLSGGTFYKTETIPSAATALSTNDVLTMEVSAVESHQQSDPWVQGSIRASMLEVRQG